MENNAVTGPGVDRIGRDRDFHEFAGYLTELLVWDCNLSPEEVRSVEEYLQRKYNIFVLEVR